jgi:short-subunit dehydrogenase
MIKKILVVGGSKGIGLSIAVEMASRNTTEKVYIVDKVVLEKQYRNPKIEFFQFDLTSSDYSFFDRFQDIDALMITAGMGRLAHFKDIPERHIIDSFNVNTLPSLRLIKKFYPKIEGPEDFYCGVMVSIAGWISSPLFAVYGATKAALKIFIESINVELVKSGTTNRILNISPGSIKGTSFNNGQTNLTLTRDLAQEIILHLENKDDLFIPKYEEIFKEVLERYHADFRKEGLHSYEYKISSGRLKD